LNPETIQDVESWPAKFMFIGLCSNYDEHGENFTIFQLLPEYPKNDPKFKRRHRVHHLFPLPTYKGDGCRKAYGTAKKL